MKRLFLIGLLIMSLNSLFAQSSASHTITISIKEFVLMDFSESKPIRLNLKSSDTFVADSDQRLHYTALVAQPVSILTFLTESLPEGYSLYISAIDLAPGSVSNTVLLDKNMNVLISNITSSSTGTGKDQGPRLIFTLKRDPSIESSLKKDFIIPVNFTTSSCFSSIILQQLVYIKIEN